MSARLSIATPHRPTSPNDIGSSESMPSNVGMSNAVDSPSPPALMISLNRQFVSSAVPNPANIRIVHNFDRYIDAYGPRVYGYTPGNSASSGPVHRLQRHTRHRREPAVTELRRPERRGPLLAGGRDLVRRLIATD